MNKLSFRPLAKNDLEEVIFYYQKINPELAERFLHETDKCILQIQKYPEAFQKRVGYVRIVFLKTFPIGIFYKKYPSEIRVIAVLHTSRNPKIWKKRK